MPKKKPTTKPPPQAEESPFETVAPCFRCGKPLDKKDYVLATTGILNAIGVMDGKEYTTVETRRIQCHGCGQVRFIKLFI